MFHIKKFYKFLNENLNDEEKLNLKLSKFKERKDFANKKFSLIGKGSARMVYLIGDKYVLKLAKNKKGIFQNKKEIEIQESKKYNDIISNIIEYDENGYYIISEKADKLTEEIFEDLTKLQSESFFYYLRFDKKQDGKNKKFYDKVNSLIKEFKLDRFDITDLSSQGVINNKPVIIDYGLDIYGARLLYNVGY